VFPENADEVGGSNSVVVLAVVDECLLLLLPEKRIYLDA